jgi:predicted dehydrogenase
MQKKILKITLVGLLTLVYGCNLQKRRYPQKGLSLIVLDPGHFHSALIQKTMYPDLDSVVHVYAADESDLKAYQDKIKKYNTRLESPTHWKEEVYTGTDFLNRMISEKKGNVVMLAGNNEKKINYIKKSIDAGLNVLADKPMAIDTLGFRSLQEAFVSAKKSKVLLYDIMTARYDITNILQRELLQIPEIFGKLEKGTPDYPAVIKESTHHFFKYISGEPLIRPTWFFDVRQQGEGIVDVTTHLVDLVQWGCFPNMTINYQKDIAIISAKRWATLITPIQFALATGANSFPDFLRKDVTDTLLRVYSNGEINYQLKGVHAKIIVRWNFQAEENEGDSHYSMIRGSKANLVIRQGLEENFKPVLYIEPSNKNKIYENNLKIRFQSIQQNYPGIELKETRLGWRIIIPKKYTNDHEATFAQVVRKYIEYLRDGSLPNWEVSNMIAKYYTTTFALKQALNN